MRYASLADELGLGLSPAFARDRQFFLAIFAAPLALALMALLLPVPGGAIALSIPILLSMVLLQPLVEELLFRGVIQGQLEKASWARHRLAGLSVANFFTTLLFALAHLVHHAPLWAAGVIIPSLVFGHFRDRHRQVFPAFLLHAFYNGCYLLAGMVSALL
ncbi:MAG TPA: JDVT-CTERM system glutamic-type intramembrane protease [Noviherbaspirillum sp.]|nr:JDVT-CTERM system glutamic-type intramembrane protease [Noviherbaspirillum sp.]